MQNACRGKRGVGMRRLRPSEVSLVGLIGAVRGEGGDSRGHALTAPGPRGEAAVPGDS